MLSSLLAFSTFAAKEPYGTVIEVPYTKTAPNMDSAAPDSTWGEKIIHVDKNTPNAALTQWTNGDEKIPKVDPNLGFDFYAKWTDEALYLCFVSPDKDMIGGSLYYGGENLQIAIVPGIVDISYCNGVSTGWTDMNEYFQCDWLISLGVDDFSLDGRDNAIEEGNIFADTKNNQIVFKFKMKYVDLGFSKNEVIEDGQYLSFSMVRADCSSEYNIGGTCTGWIEWGDFYNASKGWNTNDSLLYLARAENTKTTSANTLKLVGKNGGNTAPTTPETPDAPETPVATETPSSWAAEEVNAAIALDLVPTELRKGYTKGITRGQFASMLATLLTKAGVKTPTSATASFTDMTDANVLLAANLGIINGYKQSDGTYMFKPNNTLKRSEMSAIINRVAKLCGKTTTGYEKEVTFTDTTSHWCNSELGWPVHMGIVKGTSATTFSPENTLTIEQTVMMIYRTYTAIK